MKEILVKVPEDAWNEANAILDDLGLDIEIAVKMFLKRVAKDKTVAFILPNTDGVGSHYVLEKAPSKTEPIKVDRGDMRKSLAIKIFRERGRHIDANVTYSSKNRSTYNYWANPDFSVLRDDWTLILNDWVNRKLFLLRIPGGSISASELVARNDKPNLIDIQILEDNPNFVDRRSEYCFRRFLVDQIDY